MKKAIVIAFLVLVVWGAAQRVRPIVRYKVIRIYEPRLFSPLELQKELVSRGYNLKVDGKIGPETLAAWDVEYSKQSAAIAMEGWNQ